MSAPADQLYLLQNGQQVGPFPAASVRAMIESGAVTPDDLAWYEGLDEWRSLSTLFPGVRSAVEKTAAEHRESYSNEESYFSMILDAFSYPFRGDGLLIMILGAIFLGIIGGLSSLGGVGKFLLKGSFLLVVFYYGYTASMLQQVLHGSGQGENTLPKWPEFTDWQSDIIDPAMKWIGTFILVLGPGLATLMFGFALQSFLPGILLTALGCFYLPMGFMLVGMFDTLLALNPVVGFRSIVAIFGHYLLTVFVFGILLAMNAATGTVGSMVDGIPLTVIAYFVDGFNRLYTLVVFARILGCLYYANRHRLGWF